MKEKIKRGAVDLLKSLAIAVVIFALCVSAPHCKGLLGNHNYVVVTDGISAEQSLTKTNSRDVLVEFRCPVTISPGYLQSSLRITSNWTSRWLRHFILKIQAVQRALLQHLCRTN